EGREPCEEADEQVEDEDAGEEDRQAEPADRQDAHEVVGPRVLPHRGDDAERNRPHQRDQDRQERQLERARYALPEDVGDGALLHVRPTEVPAQRPAEPVQVLHDDRPVEAELSADLSDLLLLNGARLAAGLVDEDLGDVAGHEPQQHEDQDGRADERRDEEEQPPSRTPGRSSGYVSTYFFAGSDAWKPTLLWVPSHIGFELEWPHRHSATLGFPVVSTFAPVGSYSSTSPSTRYGPFGRAVILTG